MTIKISDHFFSVAYKSDRIPGLPDQSDLSLGANCQVFAYELLKCNGLEAGTHRSSELWADETYSEKVSAFKPLDLMLYSENGDSYGAHIGVYLGDGNVIHLSFNNGTAEIIAHTELLKSPKYRYFIGAKRILRCT